MKISLLPALLAMLPFLSLVPIPPAVAAEMEALPPPSHADNKIPPAHEDAPGNEPNVHKELTPPPPQQGVQVRSYQRQDGTGVTEYSLHGKVYEIRVQPPNGMPAYILYDSNGDGRFDRRLPGNYKHLSPPAWVIHRF